MIPLIRLYRFNRKSGSTVRRAIARAWEVWRRDPFKPTNGGHMPETDLMPKTGRDWLAFAIVAAVAVACALYVAHQVGVVG